MKNKKITRLPNKGGITGGVEICITFPTEFVKTKM